MKKGFGLLLSLFVIISCTRQSVDHSLYRFDKNSEVRWSSFENINGIKGNGGRENNGAKGHPCDSITAGATKKLLEIHGSGVINRIWMTIGDRSPRMLRSLLIEIYWDGESKPAVSAPLGDFFGTGLSQRTAMDNELFADPEGRSFICYIKMPFKKGAKICVRNESAVMIDMIFYDINYVLCPWHNDNMYFHCYWHRDTATLLTKDFVILPKVYGRGRFLGTNLGIIANPIYERSWWGEGEVKIYLDGDDEYPTLIGTGTEDYIGSAWGTEKFINRFSGCTFASDSLQQWAFYRYHIPDPVFFRDDCSVVIQCIGGNYKDKVIGMMKKGVSLSPVSIHEVPVLHPIYKKGEIADPAKEKATGWTNFYRSDDWSSTAYFYLDKPSNELPLIQNVSIRTYKYK